MRKLLLKFAQKFKIKELINWLDEDSNNPNPNPGPNPETPDTDDFTGVIWLGTNVSKWPQTSTLKAEVYGNVVNLPYDKSSIWPGRQEAGTNVNANPWVILEYEGKKYAATWEWLRTGQTSKSKVAVAGDHIKRKEIPDDWRPRSGDKIGLFVSGLVRGTTRNVQERTNVSWIVWP